MTDLIKVEDSGTAIASKFLVPGMLSHSSHERIAAKETPNCLANCRWLKCPLARLIKFDRRCRASASIIQQVQ